MANTITIPLLTDIKKGTLQIERFQRDTNKSLKSIQTQSRKASKSVSGLGKAFSSAKTQVLGFAAAFVGLQAIRGLVSSFIEFERGLAEVTTIFPITGKALDDLNKKFIETSNQFGRSATEQAKIFYQTVSAGITDAADANDVLIAANKLAIGGLSSTAGAVDILTSALNVYKGTNLTAASAADILFKTVEVGKTTVAELASSLGLILPSARALGVSFEETAAAAAALTTKGISTSIAITQLNAIFTAVLKKQDTAKKILGASSKAFSLQALRVKGLAKFLEDLNVATGGSEEVLTKLFGRVEGSKAVIALASDGFRGLNEAISKVRNSAGAADAAFKKIQDTIGEQARIALTRLINLFIQLFQVIAPGVKAGFVLINTALENSTRLIRVAAIGLAAFLLIFKAASFVSFVRGINLSTLSLKKFIVTLKASKIAITAFKIAITLGLAIVLDLIIQKILDLKEEFGGFGFVIKSFEISLLRLTLKLQNFLKNFTFLAKILPEFRADRLEVEAKKIGARIAVLQAELEALRTTSKKAAKDLGDVFKTPGGGVEITFKQQLELLLPPETLKQLGILIANIGKGADGASKAFSQFAGAIADTLLPGIGGVVSQIVDLLAQGPEASAAFVKGFIDAIPLIIENIILSIPAVVEALIVGLSELPAKIIERLPEIIAGFVRGMGKASVAFLTGLVSNSPRLITAIIKNIPKIVAEFGKEMLKIPAKLGKALVEVIKKLLGGISKGVSGAVKGIGGAVKSVGKFLGFARGGVVPGGKTSGDRVIAGLNSGELVVDRTDTKRLSNFLDSQAQNSNDRILDELKALRQQGAANNQGPMVLRSDVNIDGIKLGEILFDLEARGVRTSESPVGAF